MRPQAKAAARQEPDRALDPGKEREPGLDPAVRRSPVMHRLPSPPPCRRRPRRQRH
jgi:hypothetical protein